MNGRMTHVLHDVATAGWEPSTMTAYFHDRENPHLVARVREEIANAERLEFEIGTIVTMEDDIERGVVYVATELGDAYIAKMSSRSPDAHLVIDEMLGDWGC
jgi:hypothetical protein